MKDHTCPEILRSNLGTAVLKLKKLGVDDVIKFEFIDPPEQEALIHAQQDLYYLGALDKNCKLTKHGSLMAEFPLSPEMSKVLITSADLNCSNEILTIVSMLSAPQCFVRPNKKKKTMRQKADTIISQFAHSEGDHLSLLNVYNAYKQSEFLKSILICVTLITSR
jgi:pre-mRNA-splicing factor ATP-dependent RNA helicase DHX15/PRP43